MTIPFASYPGNRINYAGFSLECFRPSLEGTTNWPAVMEVFDELVVTVTLPLIIFITTGITPKHSFVKRVIYSIDYWGKAFDVGKLILITDLAFVACINS